MQLKKKNDDKTTWSSKNMDPSEELINSSFKLAFIVLNGVVTNVPLNSIS